MSINPNVFTKIKHKKFIIPVAFLSLISIVYIYASVKQNSSYSVGNLTLSPTPTPQLQVISVFPPSNSKPGLTVPEIAASFTFNQPISLSSVNISITPPINLTFSLSSNQKTIYAQPKVSWTIGTKYTVIISNSHQEKIFTSSFTFISPSESTNYSNQTSEYGI